MGIAPGEVNANIVSIQTALKPMQVSNLRNFAQDGSHDTINDSIIYRP